MSVTAKGETRSIADWARQLGISRQALHQRLQRHTVDDAIRDAEGRKLVESRIKRYFIVIDGVELTTEQVAELFEVSVRQVRRWAKSGLLESRAPRGLRRCRACGAEGHYRSSLECPKNSSPAAKALRRERESALAAHTARPKRYAPPSDLDLLALGIQLPPSEDDPPPEDA